MVGTMCVAVRNESLTRKPIVLCIAFVIFAIIGGVVMGLAVATSGLVLVDSPVRALLLIAMMFTLILLLLEGVGVRLMRPPSLKRQVSPAILLTHSWLETSAIWGLELGLGFLTRINSWSFWAAIFLVAWMGGPIFGAITGGVYGLARGLQPISTVLNGSGDVFKLTDAMGAFVEEARAGAMLAAVALTLTLGAVIL